MKERAIMKEGTLLGPGDLLATHYATWDRIFADDVDYPLDIFAVYMFYVYTGRWQGTNQPWCTVNFIAKGIRINVERVRRARKVLLALKLIEDVPAVNGEKAYVKINHFLRRDTLINYEGDEVELIGAGIPVRIKAEPKKETISPERKLQIVEWFNNSFWPAYPKKRRVQKAVCMEKIIKLDPTDELLQLILQKLELWKKSKNWRDAYKTDDFQFVPQIIVWINKRRWDDDPPNIIEEVVYDPNSVEYLLAELFFTNLEKAILDKDLPSIIEDMPSAIQEGAGKIRTMMTRGRTKEQMEKVLQFVGEDDWFSYKILNIDELRRFWARVVAEMARKENLKEDWGE